MRTRRTTAIWWNIGKSDWQRGWVLALPSRGSRFKPRSWQLARVIGGISSHWKVVYDKWYKNRQKSESFSGHISDWLSVVLVRAEPHKGYVSLRKCRAQQHSAKGWLHRHGKSGHLSDRLRQKAPRRYFTLTFYTSIILFCLFWALCRVILSQDIHFSKFRASVFRKNWSSQHFDRAPKILFFLLTRSHCWGKAKATICDRRGANFKK